MLLVEHVSIDPYFWVMHLTLWDINICTIVVLQRCNFNSIFVFVDNIGCLLVIWCCQFTNNYIKELKKVHKNSKNYLSSNVENNAWMIFIGMECRLQICRRWKMLSGSIPPSARNIISFFVNLKIFINWCPKRLCCFLKFKI